MKRRLSMCLICVLCLMVVLTAFPVAAAPISGTCGDNLSWTLDGGVLTISGSGEMTSAPWKDYANDIIKVVIEEGVTSIAYQAFSGCANLSDISIPDSVTVIEGRAFSFCTSLEQIVLPKNLTEIKSYTFYQSRALKDVLLPAGLTKIGEYAFAETSLQTLDFGESLQTIDDYAFERCTRLTTVTFPATLTSIGNYAFASCSSLKKLYFFGDPPAVKAGTFAHVVNATAYHPPKNELWLYGDMAPHGGSIRKQPNLGDANICGDNLTWTFADGVLTISGTGDMYNSYIYHLWSDIREVVTKVVIESGVTDISRHAFNGFTALTEISIPDTVTEIGHQAFVLCTQLKKVVIPDSVTSLGDMCFCNCTALEEAHIGSGVKTIDALPFGLCTSLKRVYFYGDAPVVRYDTLTEELSETAFTAYYPSENETWTEDVRKSYGDNITWVAFCANGHNEVTVTGKGATCTEEGLTDGKQCSVCGVVTVKQEKIPVTDHSYGNWVTVKDATEQEEGLQERTCAGCGKKDQQKLDKLPPQEAEPSTEPPTVPPTEAPTAPPTEAPTEAPTNPPVTEPPVSEPPATTPAEAMPEENGDSLWILWVGLAVVAIATVAVLLLKRKN